METNQIELIKTLKNINDTLKQIISKMEKGIVVVMAANSPALPVIIDENSSLEVGINSNNGDIDVCVHGSVTVDNDS